MQDGIIHVLNYFSVFSYPPDITELHTFLPVATTKEHLKDELELMKKSKLIVTKHNRYALPKHDHFFAIYEKRSSLSKIKKEKIERYITALSKYTCIKGIAITGSISMLNAEEDGDVDLCIITASGRIWTARLTSLLIAHTFGIRRKHSDTHFSNSVCLNLFFDENYLEIPDVKKNEYIGHELLQMKKIYDVDHTCDRLIYLNEWVFDLFPNAPSVILDTHCHSCLPTGTAREGGNLQNIKVDSVDKSGNLLNKIGDILEFLAKHLQLFFMRKHTTTERISDEQLWFFPDDFQKKLEKKIPITSL